MGTRCIRSDMGKTLPYLVWKIFKMAGPVFTRAGSKAG
jgi:hypothetical protein